MTATVKTVQFVDPRIEPQPDPLYDYVIAPQQNQYYKIAASSKSNHSLNFNNLTTLGVDRAYLDTFEIELTCTFAFHLAYPADDLKPAYGNQSSQTKIEFNNPADIRRFLITNDCFTFESFPFNKCCQNATVNINGGAFQSEPMMYIRAKEHYMKQDALVRSYANVCPCIRPMSQYESGRRYWMPIAESNEKSVAAMRNNDEARMKSRFTSTMPATQQSQSACDGIAYAGMNNSIIKLGKKYRVDSETNTIEAVSFEKLYVDANNPQKFYLTVTWREPVFCSPFSSRYDADYGRPLYNITSMDLAFTMCDLGNMIRLAPPSHGTAYTAQEDILEFETGDADPVSHTTYRGGYGLYIDSYSVNIDAANLCYQVMTIPPVISKPLTTLVPYRRFVPYLTDVRNTVTRDGQFSVSRFGETTNVYSGVYTLNEIPTAIWAFVAPSKAIIQTNPTSFQGTRGISGEDGATNFFSELPAWDSNKQFAAVNNVNITMANTTQILSTASREDLYRICKANGCEDLFSDWDMGQMFVGFPFKDGYEEMDPRILHLEENGFGSSQIGTGSVLRFKPGVDLIVPDQPLIPAANANNMVLQFSGNFTIPPNAKNLCEYALWLIFEYVGVAAISPGQCEISMNPLGSGEIMAVSPVMSSSSADSAGELEGSGFWGRLKNMFRNKDRVVDTLMTVVPKVRQGIDVAEGILNKLKRPRDSDDGEGESGSSKRARGGAVIGRGLNDWTA